MKNPKILNIKHVDVGCKGKKNVLCKFVLKMKRSKKDEK